MTIKGFFSFRENRFFWLNILGMVLFVCIVPVGVLKWLDHYTHHGEAVVVPDVKGMLPAQAEGLFSKQGLTCVVADSVYREEQPAGCILDYNPGKGQKVKQGRVIYLTINTTTTPLCDVPDVADNSSLREAEARFRAARFTLDEVERIAGEKDWVYGVKYKGRMLEKGEKVPIGAVLTLVAGNGEDEMPGDSLQLEQTLPEVHTTEEVLEDDWF